MRARDLGIAIGDLPPGPLNAITDVPGVRIGHATLISGDGPLVVGQGPIRTGVTVILPREGDARAEPAFAASHTLNGYGEMTGLEWVRESGMLMSPIAMTNTHSVGVVRDALIEASIREGLPAGEWALPVVGETWDGYLNDVNGLHVRPKHVFAALAEASAGPVVEGNVGGGTGMKAFGFKAGIGTSSRRVQDSDGGYTVGVLVQANHGRRERLAIDGVPVGREIPLSEIPWPEVPDPSAGSIISIVATDAPLLPHQCRRLAQRSSLGIARVGGGGEHDSGDIFFAFATGNRTLHPEDREGSPRTFPLTMLNDDYLDDLYWATIEATEEAIVNSLVAAETMVGRDGITFHALPHDRLVEVMRRYGRLA
ncbi:MAG: P1 family peptidase [Chloroflexota bacterium]|nr:P1 family peptidase [Chloroflexota bacterium]